MPYYCNVCGLEEEFEIEGYDICSCCGYEPLYDGKSPTQVKRYRDKWLKNGAKWFSPEYKPMRWDLKTQFQNIPLEFQ